MADFFDLTPPGTRVVVRYKLGQEGGSGAPRVSDALGELLAVESTTEGRIVRILTRRGEVSIPTSAITHAKRVPPPPAKHTPPNLR
ncbi:MAG: putative acetyltransferase [Galactobacter sp.]